VLGFLRASGLAAADEMPETAALTGGVSSDIWKVSLRSGPVCVKRALPRLRVAQVWEAPVERNRYEWRWMQVAARIVPGCAPRVLAQDEAGGLFAMEFSRRGAPSPVEERAACRPRGRRVCPTGRRQPRAHPRRDRGRCSHRARVRDRRGLPRDSA
jgi:hypothetical protein